MSAKVAGKNRAIGRMPKGHIPTAASSPSKSRRKANVDVPAKAIRDVPSAESRTASKKKARIVVPNGQAVLVSSPTLPNASGAAQSNRATNGHLMAGRSAKRPTVGGDVHENVARTGHQPVDLSSDILFVRQLYRQRRDLLKAATALTLRMIAMVKAANGLERDAKVSERMIQNCAYPPVKVLAAVRGTVRVEIASLEKELVKYATRMPGYEEIWKPTSGLGALGLALIIGAAGDLRNYDNHSKLWKRMGLHVFDGKALYTKRAGMSSAEWKSAGYCPERRSLMYTIVNLGICTKQSAYKQLRDDRIKVEHQKAKAEGLKVALSGKIPKKEAHLYRSAGHVLNRANRYVGKKLLRDLWKVWRREAMAHLPKGRTASASRSPIPFTGIRNGEGNAAIF